MGANKRVLAAMSDYPEKTCEIDRLILHPKFVAAALDGSKTEQRRDGVYAWPGEHFLLDGVDFICTELVQQRLGDMGDDGARAEGFDSFDGYKNLILRMHPSMEWNPDALVWLHRFRRCDAAEESQID